MRRKWVFIALTALLGCAPRPPLDRAPAPELTRIRAGHQAGLRGWQHQLHQSTRAPRPAELEAWEPGHAPPSLEEVERAIDHFQRERRGSGPALDTAWPPFLELVEAYLAQAPERLSLAPLVRARVAAEFELDRDLARADGPPSELAQLVAGLVGRIERKVFAIRTVAEAASRSLRPDEAGGLAWPLSHGVLTSGFGARRDPLQPTRIRFHHGIDLAAPSHEPVYAAAAGTVVKAGWGGSGGRVVKLRHADGRHTLYAHLAMILVQLEQEVGEGDVIGQVGDSGRATGPHLHFAVLVDGRAEDPLDHLRSVPMSFSDTEPGVAFGYGE